MEVLIKVFKQTSRLFNFLLRIEFGFSKCSLHLYKIFSFTSYSTSNKSSSLLDLQSTLKY